MQHPHTKHCVRNSSTPHTTGPVNGRSVLLRRGLLAWASAYKQMPTTPLPAVTTCAPAVPPAVAMELVQVMVGLILSDGKGCMSCLN